MLLHWHLVFLSQCETPRVRTLSRLVPRDRLARLACHHPTPMKTPTRRRNDHDGTAIPTGEKDDDIGAEAVAGIMIGTESGGTGGTGAAVVATGKVAEIGVEMGEETREETREKMREESKAESRAETGTLTTRTEAVMEASVDGGTGAETAIGRDPGSTAGGVVAPNLVVMIEGHNIKFIPAIELENDTRFAQHEIMLCSQPTRLSY